jgi:hypothetical protein
MAAPAPNRCRRLRPSPTAATVKVLSTGTFDAYTTSTVGTSYLGT